MRCSQRIRCRLGDTSHHYTRLILPFLDERGSVIRLLVAIRQEPGTWIARCAACGDCVLGETFGLCPVARCAKSLSNGPCGGTRKEGKCEVDENIDCVWFQIYERANQILHDDAAWIFINHMNQVRAARANVKGFQLNPLQMFFNMEKVSLE